MSKTVLITGSTSGIGLGIAKEFASNGYTVAFNGLEANGAEIAQEISDTFGIKTGFYPVDLSSHEAIQQMINQVESSLRYW